MPTILIPLSFAIWLFLFRAFLSGELAITYDAVPYYEHIKFFIDQITQGILPLWDPTRDGGVPNEFFLRRFGEFNPFLWIIVILHKAGLSYIQSYLGFLAIYYLVGLVGFYVLAKEFLKDSRLAMVAYLLFLFSSFGTTLFKSFMVLLFVPMVWFFYFLWMFTQRPQRWSLLGIVFTLMLIVTTYVPFYFLTIFLVFISCLILCYGVSFKEILSRYQRFIRQNKFFSFMCLILIGLALLPGWLFLLEIKTGELVFPQRQPELTQEALSVPAQTMAMGGIPATSLSGRLLSNINDLQTGQFYIPIFAYILFSLGIITALNKRLVVLTLWALMIYLMALYDATPIYPFLYEYIPFFKYFRNFQFFLWIPILPILILICVDQLKSFLEFKPSTQRQKIILLALIVIIHLGLLVFMALQSNVVLSSYIVLGLSLLFFSLYLIGRMENSRSFMLFATVLIMLQPLEVYSYLTKNAPKSQPPYRYDQPYMSLKIMSPKQKEKLIQKYAALKPSDLSATITKPPLTMYMTTRWDILFRDQFSTNLLDDHLLSKLVFYDAPNEPADFLKGHVVTMDSPETQVIFFDANSLRLKTQLSKPQYLVYHDHYENNWRAFVDGKNASLERAHIAFKGLWVPAGSHEIYFHYGDLGQYVLKYALMILFGIVFIAVIALRFKYE